MYEVHVSGSTRYKENNKELIEALESIDIETYLDSEGIEYRPTHGTRGAQFNLQSCPKCGGSKWKVYLNQESGLGNCFHGSCEAKFNKYSFIEAHTGLQGRELIEYIKAFAKTVGWLPKRVKPTSEAIKGELVIPESFAIPHMGRNLKYLMDRGITSEVAKYFRLRYCNAGYFRYPDPEGGWAFQDYSKRVIIPIHDLDDNLVSFQGRDITGESEKKYLFPPGFAATGAHLYNGHNAVGIKRVLAGEGVFDVAASYIALQTDSSLVDVVPIGTFGKSLSAGNDNSQIQKFITLKKHGLQEVTFMWDGELLAMHAAVKSGMMLLQLGLKVKIALLPFEKDPNEVPPEVVVNAFKNATPLTKLSAAKLLLISDYEKAIG